MGRLHDSVSIDIDLFHGLLRKTSSGGMGKQN